MTTTDSRIGRLIGRLARVWAELNYAQRRSFELQTGIPVLTRRARPRIARSAHELETLYGSTWNE